ncbi:amidotransferase 1, exosortase A system-associated [Iodidimonas muriae]|uniref:asparagine synthase (glutamine-hydrolyzing) n=1 Tax=Iodidimonas muriae TaxID=261467 RepID=A0ABQ2L6A3_9PROT|nr:XrtA/PEP-CTERM system amidotransferase [Iodidimonas muriae]GER06476.1 amidotransferase 1, exosortase A system-associated [Kordiimonadales bacterium JCM 17843]GGO04910.1 amidotransferase 1, exosortase A system-associated [Iodidimonas muriae]
MCGLTGIFDLGDRRSVDRAMLREMNDAIGHRGPDDDGFYVEPGVGLGHRRLSIIDLAGGHQPMFNEDETICVVYNGEIYNFAALARTLSEKGHHFQTRSDTEVIVHAWEEWGPSCVEHFRGMFAFALYDKNRQTLFLARDRLGIKPLYYAFTDDGFLIFGSELKSLLPYPGLGRELDPRSVEDFFALGYVPDPRSIYKSVQKLAPAHILVQQRGKAPASPHAYWDMRFDRNDGIPEGEQADALRANLEEAVRIRLVSEVPLGAFLSGGVDSSAVVAMMAKAQPDPVNTCSISFGDKDYDESLYARKVAKQFKTTHHERLVDPEDFDLLMHLPQIYDEPFADSSALPTYRVCEEARRHVTVALSGDGGDEVFAGYRRYRWHDYEERVRRVLPQALRGPLFGLAGGIYPKMDWAPRPLRAKSTLQALARSSAEGYFHSVSILSNDVRESLYSEAFKRDLQGYRAVELIQHHMEKAPTDHHLSRAQYVDMKTYLPGDILTKVDRASMAHSLEVRVPLLDHQFVEWSGSVAPSLKLRNREGKYIFKKSLEPMLPNDVLYRPKMGFAVPLARWFRGPLKARVREAVLGGALFESGFFNQACLHQLVESHMSGVRDHSQPLWALMMFAGFLDRVHGKKAKETQKVAV